jgi:hypothetical protein
MKRPFNPQLTVKLSVFSRLQGLINQSSVLCGTRHHGDAALGRGSADTFLPLNWPVITRSSVRKSRRSRYPMKVAGCIRRMFFRSQYLAQT